MGIGDKLNNKAEEAEGKVKKEYGDAVGNDRLSTEGRAQEASGDVKQAGEKVKDAFKDATD